MTKRIVAIGGGENERQNLDGTFMPYETGPMDKEIIRLTGKKHPNVLVIAHSKPLENQEYYFEVIKNIYGGKYGCNCKNLTSDQLIDLKYTNKLTNWADIIYEVGGNTLDMIKLWKDTGFDLILKKAWEAGKVMCGVSAGANCWFKECSSDSLRIKYGPDQPLIAVECLGFYDGFFVPHCDEPGRYESAKELLKDKDSIGLLLSNCAALEIIDDEFRIITSDASFHNINPYALKTYWKDGEYIEESIDLSQKFKSITELYKKE